MKKKELREMLMLALLVQHPRYDETNAKSIIKMNAYEAGVYSRLYNMLSMSKISPLYTGRNESILDTLRRFFSKQSLTNPFDTNLERRDKMLAMENRMRKLITDQDTSDAILIIAASISDNNTKKTQRRPRKRKERRTIDYDIVRSAVTPRNAAAPKFFTNVRDDICCVIGATTDVDIVKCALNQDIPKTMFDVCIVRSEPVPFDRLPTKMLIFGGFSDMNVHDITENINNIAIDQTKLAMAVADAINMNAVDEKYSEDFAALSIGDKIYFTKFAVFGKDGTPKYSMNVNFSIIITHRVVERGVLRVAVLSVDGQSDKEKNEDSRQPDENISKEVTKSDEQCESCTGPVEFTIYYNLFKAPHKYDLLCPMRQQIIKYGSASDLDGIRNASISISKSIYEDVFHKHPEDPDYNSEKLQDAFSLLMQVLLTNVDDILYVHDVRCRQTGEKLMLEKFFCVIDNHGPKYVNNLPMESYTIMKLAD